MGFKTSPQVRYYRDTYAEHPEDRKNIEYSVHLDSEEDLVTLSRVYEQLKLLDDTIKLDYARCDHTRHGNEEFTITRSKHILAVSHNAKRAPQHSKK